MQSNDNTVKYSALPWAVEDGTTLIWANVDEIGKAYPIAQVDTPHDWRYRPSHEEKVATAQLIAAAPELLEALDSLVVYMRDVEPQEEYLDVWQEAIKAIAKAEGRANV